MLDFVHKKCAGLEYDERSHSFNWVLLLLLKAILTIHSIYLSKNAVICLEMNLNMCIRNVLNKERKFYTTALITFLLHLWPRLGAKCVKEPFFPFFSCLTHSIGTDRSSQSSSLGEHPRACGFSCVSAWQRG